MAGSCEVIFLFQGYFGAGYVLRAMKDLLLNMKFSPHYEN